uniref:mRNA_decap_C domain-containing protein n=1 Tax=Strongyloides venezuelensis TaxID=75913 RepID=A0A0K0F1S8_STRVS
MVDRTPMMEQNALLALQKNFTQISRIDPTVENVIAFSKYTAVYDFVNGKWAKTDIDGPMFVYKRNTKPEYGICIANRTSTPDFIENISFNLKLKFKPPYILAYFPSGMIKGLWFYDSSQCSKIYNVMQKLIERCSQEADNVEIQEEPDMAHASVKEENQESQQHHHQQQQQQQQQLSPNNLLAQMLGSKLKIGENLNESFSSTTTTTTDKLRNSGNKSIVKQRKNDNNGSNMKKEVVSTVPVNSMPPTEECKKVSVCEKVPGLTKEQFKAAFINLLESDDAFLTSLHNSYSNVLGNALNCTRR